MRWRWVGDESPATRHGHAYHVNDGFSIVPCVFDGAELDGIVGNLEAASLQRSRAGARHLLAIPAVAAFVRDPRLIALAAKVLGRDPVPIGATLFDKSPEANWLVVWHQDTALPLLESAMSPAGDRGRRRAVSSTRTLRPARSRKWSHCACTLTPPPPTTGRCVSFREPTASACSLISRFARPRSASSRSPAQLSVAAF